MVEHTQTIRRQFPNELFECRKFPDEMFECVDHFVGLAFKELIKKLTSWFALNTGMKCDQL